MRQTFFRLVTSVCILSAIACAARSQIFQVADSVAEFSGIQGGNNWRYGYFNGNSVQPYGLADFEPLTIFDGNWHLTWPPQGFYTALWSHGGHPNTGGNGSLFVRHWAVRRWVSEVSGRITITGTYSSCDFPGVACNGGSTRIAIMVNGMVVWERNVASSTTTSYSVTTLVEEGQPVDFIVDPLTTDVNDGTLFTSRISFERRVIVLAVGVFDGGSSHAGGVAASRVASAIAPWSQGGDRHVLLLDTANAGNRQALETQVESIRATLQPGDTFVLYVNSHGFFDVEGAEPPVLADDPNCDGAMGPCAPVLTTGDERLFLSSQSSTENISDNDLVGLFSGPSWSSVNKLFVIDTCYAGGFTNELVSLPRSSAIRASEEAKFSWARRGNPPFMPDLSTGILGMSLADALMARAGDQTLNFYELFDAARVAGSGFKGGSGFVQGGFAAWANPGVIDFEPGAAASTTLGGGLFRPCPGDAFGDGRIDFLDLNAVLGGFGQSGSGALGDVNGDGVVDFMDLNIVLSHYGRAC